MAGKQRSPSDRPCLAPAPPYCLSLFPLQQQPVLDLFDTLHFRRQLRQHSCIMLKGTVRLVTCATLATLKKYTVVKSELHKVVLYQQVNTRTSHVCRSELCGVTVSVTCCSHACGLTASWFYGCVRTKRVK